MTTLSEEMSNSCEGKIASDECLLALKEFENGKSPGSDGFTNSFEWLNFTNSFGKRLAKI